MKITVSLAKNINPSFAAQEIKTISEQLTGLPGYIKVKTNPSVSIGSMVV